MSVKKTWQRAALILATGFGSGYFPIAPGTAGSAAAIPIYFALVHANHWIYGAVLVAFTALAILAAGVAETHVGRKDPGVIVVDEMAGMLLTLFLVPFSLTAVAIGFVVFRISDVIKPFPGRRCEKLPGGWGIVLDDLVAGLYANLCLQLLRLTDLI